MNNFQKLFMKWVADYFMKNFEKAVFAHPVYNKDPDDP